MGTFAIVPDGVEVSRHQDGGLTCAFCTMLKIVIYLPGFDSVFIQTHVHGHQDIEKYCDKNPQMLQCCYNKFIQ